MSTIFTLYLIWSSVFLTWPVNATKSFGSNTLRFFGRDGKPGIDSSIDVVTEPPRQSTGLTNAVQWDNYTLFVEGQRVFIQCVPSISLLRLLMPWQL